MTAHDGPPAFRAVEGGFAAGYSSVVFLVRDAGRQGKASAKRQLINYAVARKPQSPLRAIRTDYSVTQSNIVRQVHVREVQDAGTSLS